MKKSLGLAVTCLFIAALCIDVEAAPVESRFNMSLGGYVKLDYVYQSAKLGVPLTVPVPADGTVAAEQDESIFSARQSRLNLRVNGPDYNGAKTMAFIEGDFFGAGNNENATIRMRHAYGQLAWENTQILFGQFWDIFGPGNMSTIDFRTGAFTGAPNNPRVPQARLTHTFNFGDTNSLMVIGGLQNPVQNFAGDQFSGSLPNVAGQVMFQSKALGVAPGYWGLPMRPLTAGVFGLYGEADIDGADDIEVHGYGAYVFVPVLKSSDGKSRAMTLSVDAQIYASEGLSVQGANARMINAFGDAAKGYGGFAQFIFHPVHPLGLTAGYGRRQITDAADYRPLTAPNPDTGAVAAVERYNEMYFANVHFDLNAAIRIAAEYQRLKTQYLAVPTGATGDSGSADVFRVAAMYFF